MRFKYLVRVTGQIEMSSRGQLNPSTANAFDGSRAALVYKLLTACEACLAEAATRTAKMNALRLKSLVLLMRYSGTRISDAVTITTDRLDGNKLFLYTQKTGVPVYTVLPDSVLRALESTPRVTTKNFFWSGECKREGAAGLWEKRLKELFAQAGVSKGAGNAVSHRFRDTFAVELLLAGVPIERVSILLGHQSVRITEKHYNPWVRSRQEQLEADVARTWERDPVLNLKTQLATVKKYRVQNGYRLTSGRRN